MIGLDAMLSMHTNERMLKASTEKRTRYIRQQLESMTEEQLSRFEFFMRSHFSRHTIRNILNDTLDAKYGQVNDETAIVVCGLTKLFVSELMENGQLVS